MRLRDCVIADSKNDRYYGRELWDAWEEFGQKEWYSVRGKERTGRSSHVRRIAPMVQAIKEVPGVMPWEDFSQVWKAASSITVIRCACRHQARRCSRSTDTCFQLDNTAEYFVKRGCARKLTYEEAMEILYRSEEEGLVYRFPNWRDVKTVCLCCDDCCICFVSSRADGKPFQEAAKSRFQVMVDQDLCSGCQICVGRCFYEAIAMEKSSGSKRLKAAIDTEKCFGCGSCVVKCPTKALSVKLVRPEEHVPVSRPAGSHQTSS